MNTIQNACNSQKETKHHKSNLIKNIFNNLFNLDTPTINFKVAKWGILILSSFLIMGDFYAYDNPYAIKERLRLKFSSTIPTNFDYYFNLLYSVYTFPNIFMPFLNGYITDKVIYLIIFLVFIYCVIS